MAKSIYPCLWFEDNAHEAAEFYCKIFPNSKILQENNFVVSFEINGQYIMGLKGRRPPHHFNEAFSFVIPCENQQEIDHYWNNFTKDGGREDMCGWCKDKFGLSWQVIPAKLNEWMADPVKAPKVVEAFMKMRKFDIATLENA